MNWYKEKIQPDPLFLNPSRVIDRHLLYPPFADLIIALYTEARNAGLNVEIFETYRSERRQYELFLASATKKIKNGMHHYGVACDVVFKDKKGNWTWVGDWKTLGKIGRELGLFWGGDWKSFVDCPHFQYIPATQEAQGLIIAGIYESSGA